MPIVRHSRFANERLPDGQKIRVINAPLFLATKLESFSSRGQGDYLHHDLEDVVVVLHGLPGIVAEVRASMEAREFLEAEFEALLSDPAFDDRLLWLLNGEDARKPLVLERVRRIIGL